MRSGHLPANAPRRPLPSRPAGRCRSATRIGLITAGTLAALLAGCAHRPAVAGPATCRAPTDDTLRPIPPALAPAVIAAFRVTMTPAEVERNGVIRCAGGAVLACLTGANLNCGKADTRRHNPGAAYWCRTHPNADFVPLFAAGHASIFAWRCDGSRPVSERVVQPADARGFSADHWRVVVPAPGGGTPPG